MKVIFVDASPTMLAKNHFLIAETLNKKDTDFEAIFVSLNLSSFVNVEIEKESLKKLLFNKAFKHRTVKENEISNFLQKNKPDLIFIGGYRLFDMLWIAVGRENNIPTYQLQHGFEIENLHYKPHILIVKFFKVIYNLKILYLLSKILKKSFLKMSYQYLQYFFSGKQLKVSLFNNPKFYPAKIFVYSEYYKEFWNNKFGLPKENMEIISPSDFQLIPAIQKRPRINACCYLTQTLVEDGRMTKKVFFNKIIKEYIKIANNIGHFIVKLHPRSNVSLYDDLVALPNVSIMREFPNCSVYLTHYSSMAYTAFMFSNSVILHELPSHPTPKVFIKVASLISQNIESIIKEIKMHINDKQPQIETQINNIGYYAAMDNIDPVLKISEVVLSNFITKYKTED